MSVRYVGVQWNKFKIAYDVVAIGSAALFIAAYEGVTRATHTGPTEITSDILDMRALGACAFVLLSAILAIGPLARLSPRLWPLGYNRRHLGVAMAVIALVHALKVIGYYDEYGSVRPLVAFLENDAAVTHSTLPFQLFGAGALVILVTMAATSHDFWQRLLGRAWKSLHMLVYVAYLLVVSHVAFGALQDEPSLVLSAGFAAIVLGVATLHVLAAIRSTRLDRAAPVFVERGGVRWLDAGLAKTIPTDRARAVCVPGGERIAVIRTKGKVSALHGVCAHQGGPLYEGKVIDGSLTCPWHGWQYRPEDGCSPPPFTEKLPTYRVCIAEGRVLVDPRALPPGTATPPAAEEDA